MEELKRVFIHIRWPLQSFTLLGFLISVVSCRIQFSAPLLIQFISWFLLCAGITVFNSYYDKDTHPVAGLENPPTTSNAMLYGTYALKSMGFFLALFLNNSYYLALYLLTIILSVLYSHDSFRFKANGYVAVLFNFIIGAFTFIVPTILNRTELLVVLFGSIGSGLFLASIYLMMQVHQRKEDKERNDRSIMVMHGRKITLSVSILFLMIAGLMLFLALHAAQFSYQYIVILLCYFSLVILLNYLWLRKKGGSLTDFIIMNRLTLRISYLTNVMLLAIYINEVILKPSR